MLNILTNNIPSCKCIGVGCFAMPLHKGTAGYWPFLSYPLLCLLFLLLFIIPSSASYLQVQNSTEVQSSNLSEYDCSWTVNNCYVNIPIPLNISGGINISYAIKTALITATVNLELNGNSIKASTATTSYQTFYYSTNRMLNTTDTLQLHLFAEANPQHIYSKLIYLNYSYVFNGTAGGYSWDWKNDSFATFYNTTTWDKGDNNILVGLTDLNKSSATDNFNDGTNDWLSNMSSGYSASTGVFISNDPNCTTVNYCYYVQNVNVSNFDIVVIAKSLVPPNRFGVMGQVQSYIPPVSFDYYFHYFINNNTYNQILLNGIASAINNTANENVQLNTWYVFRYQEYNNSYNKRGKMWTYVDAEPTTWENVGTNNSLKYGKVGLMSNTQTTYFESFWVRNVDSNGNLISVGNFTYQFNLLINQTLKYIYTNLSGNISVYANTSDDLITWTGDVLVGTNITSKQFYEVSTANKQRYAKITYQIYGEQSAYPYLSTYSSRIYDFKYVADNHPSIEGYVHYPNGTTTPNATVVYNFGTTTTDTSGYYNFSNINTSSRFGLNVTFVAGLSGYKPIDNYIVNINGSNTNVNFTLRNYTQPIPNVFATESEEIVNYQYSFMNESGCIDSPELQGGNHNPCDNNQDNLGSTASHLFNKSFNTTPEFFEKTLRIGKILNDVYLPTAVAAHNSRFHMMWYTEYMAGFENQVSAAQWNVWNQTLINYNITGDDYYGALPGASNTGLTNSNWDAIEIDGLYLIYKFTGRQDALIRVTNISQKIANQTTDTGYIPNTAESGLQTTYNAVYFTLGSQAIIHGYNNATFSDAIRRGLNWTYNIELMSGDLPVSGRSTAIMNIRSNYMLNGFFGQYLFPESFNIADVYRRADMHYQAIQYFKIQSGHYYGINNYYEPSYLVGFPDYALGGNANDARISWWEIWMSDIYNPLFVESDTSYLPVYNEFNSSRLGIINKGNYSIYTQLEYWPIVNQNYTTFNGTGIYPLRFVPTCRYCLNWTVFPNPQVTTNQSYDEFLNFFFLNDSSGRWKFNAKSFNFANANYSIGDGYIWVNVSGLNFTQTGNGSLTSPDGAPYKSIQYYNYSVVTDGDLMHYRYALGFNSSQFDIKSMLQGIELLITDNRTVASIQLNGNNLNFSRGNETLNITNTTVSSGGSIVSFQQDGGLYGGFIGYGYHNRTNWNISVTSSPIVLEYDMRISTKNVYGYVLNQPPGIFYHSTTPIMSIVNTSVEFSVSGTQGGLNWTWHINGTQVQTNNSFGGGQKAYYSNSTAIIGEYLINATGCNVVGCTTQLWDWNVISGHMIPSTPIGLTYTNGSTWVNHTWNPGSGNITDSYNISHNGGWTNGSINTYYYDNIGFGNWSNISVYPYNSSYLGTLNLTPVSQNVKTPNALIYYNPPTPVSCSSLNGTTWINVSCSSGAGNTTDGMNITNVNTSAWSNSTSFYWNNTGLAQGTNYTYHVYAWNATSNNLSISYATVLNRTNITILPLVNDSVSLDNWIWDLQNGAYISVPYIFNATNFTLTSGQLQFWLNNSKIQWRTNNNKTLTNIKFNYILDRYSFNASGTSGYLNFSGLMNNVNSNYSLYVDSSLYQNKLSDIIGNITFNYTGSWSDHNFTILSETIIPPENNTTPLISNVTNQTCEPHSCVISFDVNQTNAITRIRYGLTPSMTLNTVNQTTNLHRTNNLTSLNNNSLYYYTVDAWNSTNTVYHSNSTIQTFTTTEDYIPIPPTSAPIVISWTNDYTNNNDLTLSILNTTNISFSITANQTLSSCTWTGIDAEISISGTSCNAYRNVSTASETITARGVNPNGSTQVISWIVFVPGGGVPIITSFTSDIAGESEYIQIASGTPITFTVIASDASSYSWYIDKKITTTHTSSYIYTPTGYHTISVTALNSYGTSAMKYKNIVISQLTAVALIPDINTSYYDTFEGLLENPDAVSIINFIPSPYTHFIGSTFYLILWALVGLMIWIRSDKITVPTTLGFIIGGAVLGTLPEQYRLISQLIIVGGLFAALFIFFKEKK